MNHLRTTHYHLGLVCALCVDFFSTSTNAMQQDAYMCKSIITAKDNDREEEEYENDNDSDEDEYYLLKEALTAS